MAVRRRLWPRRRLLLAAMATTAAMLVLLLSALWLPEDGVEELRDPPPATPSGSFFPGPVPEEWAEPGEATPPIPACPGRPFQAALLLGFLRSSLPEDQDDVLLEPYLQSWDQLLRQISSLPVSLLLPVVFPDTRPSRLPVLMPHFLPCSFFSSFMESLGSMVGFFSQKVREKVVLIRQLSIKDGARTSPDHRMAPAPSLKSKEYRSVRSMVEAELRDGVVDFSRRSDSGCRTLLRLHRSLLWLQLLLEGLSRGPDGQGRYRTPGELCRDAYAVALAPHHPWLLRQAAELVFLALPDRNHFLRLVCVEDGQDPAPVLRVVIRALALVHGRTQRILERHGMLELP